MEWPEQWVPKAALTNFAKYENTSKKQRELKNLLESILRDHPERLPERKLLLKTYLETGEINNALNQYRYILSETEPPIEFMKEASVFGFDEPKKKQNALESAYGKD